MDIRASLAGDVASIAALFTESVHQIAARSYDPVQLDAWAPKSPDLKQWQSRLAPLETLVADFEGVMGGFISYTSKGHIELLYTSPEFSRRGVASRLLGEVVQILRLKGIEHFSTEASVEARPFFEAKGFKVIEEQIVERHGVQLRRFLMAHDFAESDAQQGNAAGARTERG